MEKNSLVRLYALKEVSRGEKTGYDLMHDLGQYKGGKKPSPGTMYPLLKDLLETKLIKVRQDGRKKLYSITAKGTKTLKELEDRHASIMREHEKLLKTYSGLSKTKSTYTNVLKLVKNPLDKNKWMRYNMDIIGELKQEMWKVMNMPFDEKKADLWRKQMKKDIEVLKKLQK